LSHTYNQFLTTTVNYTATKDLFAEIFEQKGFSTIVKRGNFGSVNKASISLSAQKPIVKWWTAIVYTEYNYNDYKGYLNGEDVRLKLGNFLVNINNHFKFQKTAGVQNYRAFIGQKVSKDRL